MWVPRPLKLLLTALCRFTQRRLAYFCRLKNVEALRKVFQKDYVITKELSTLVGSLALRCGRMLMVANTALITTKHIDFSRSVHAEHCRAR